MQVIQLKQKPSVGSRTAVQNWFLPSTTAKLIWTANISHAISTQLKVCQLTQTKLGFSLRILVRFYNLGQTVGPSSDFVWVNDNDDLHEDVTPQTVIYLWDRPTCTRLIRNGDGRAQRVFDCVLPHKEGVC